MTPDAAAALAELSARSRAIGARTLAEALGWHKPGDHIPHVTYSKDRAREIFDEHRAHGVLRRLEAAGLVEVVISRAGTRYRLRR